MDRKAFLQTCGLISTGMASGLAVPGIAYSKPDDSDGSRKVTILYTNDTHSHITPFPDSAGELAGLGGYARRASLIKSIRKQHKHVLLLDAGDIFQGTPYFNFYGGRLELELMSRMGYDAAAIGNHEFDNGTEGFAEVAPKANFPFVCANYHVRGSAMEPFVENFIIKQCGEIKIGIFGLGIDFKNLVLEKNHKGVRYRDAKLLAEAMVRSLRQYKKCDYVICLSHLGYRYDDETRISDRDIAHQVDGIDLIIGGHTHTFLDKPVAVKNTDQHQTLITQVGWGGVILGRLDLTFSPQKKVLKTVADNLSVGPYKKTDKG